MRVLAVDDDAVAPILFGAIAKKMDIEIVTAVDCSTALSLLKSSQFDVILMDLNLKGVDGFECTRQVRAWQEEVGCRQPIIAVTGYAMSEDRTMCLQSGMDDYLSKPYQIKDLSELLIKWSQSSITPVV
ncbi:MAG TPA: response regulator [Candidatus Melainabacteria bacterium]|jgi:CheY-like chemotaxis protein|nr:response regulator [Candidatus Melainabacteria bacterium]HIN63340.1 response regulator [Candidatus Obscuribacterales bacterium]